MVHRPIDLKEARRIKNASAAIDKEFNKLDARGFVDWNKVMEKEKAGELARDRKKQEYQHTLAN